MEIPVHRLTRIWGLPNSKLEWFRRGRRFSSQCPFTEQVARNLRGDQFPFTIGTDSAGTNFRVLDSVDCCAEKLGAGLRAGLTLCCGQLEVVTSAAGNGIPLKGHGTRILVPKIGYQLSQRISTRQLSEKLSNGTPFFHFSGRHETKKTSPAQETKIESRGLSGHDSGHLRSQKEKSSEKIYHGEISKSGKRIFTAVETLFLFEQFRKHHNFNPQKKEDVDAAKELVKGGGDNCKWSEIAKRIARENPKQFGAEHRTGDISRQALKRRIKAYLGGQHL
jgi:hypothetical protein